MKSHLPIHLIDHQTVFLPGWGFRGSVGKALCEKLSYDAVVPHYLELSDIMNHRVSVNKQHVNLLSKKAVKTLPQGAILIGWSLGGLFALYLCHLFPDRWRNLILISTTPKFISDTDWPGVSLEMAERFKREAKRNINATISQFIRWMLFPVQSVVIEQYLKDNLVNFNDYPCIHLLKILFTLDLRSAISVMDIPILYILGEQDPLVPPDIKDHFQLKNQYSKVKVIPKAGHLPFLTHNVECVRLIHDFLSTIPQ